MVARKRRQGSWIQDWPLQPREVVNGLDCVPCRRTNSLGLGLCGSKHLNIKRGWRGIARQHAPPVTSSYAVKCGLHQLTRRGMRSHPCLGVKLRPRALHNLVQYHARHLSLSTAKSGVIRYHICVTKSKRRRFMTVYEHLSYRGERSSTSSITYGLRPW